MSICIISSDSDQTTNDVIDWLHKFKKEVIRINSNSVVSVERISTTVTEFGILLLVDGKKVALKDIKSVWYRRGKINLSSVLSSSADFQQDNEVVQFHKSELRIIEEYIDDAWKEVRAIDSFKLSKVNKLVVLKHAQRCGLTIPPTIVTGSKEELLSFKEEHTSIICKAVYELFDAEATDGLIKCYTETVGDELLASLSDRFFPSLFQKKVLKQYELRIFFLQKKLYSMAIFSQNDSKTENDFRKYNHTNPNRKVPYALSNEIETKILSLIQVLGLTSGSIDMILDKNGEYYFLEVNPIGQFGMISAPCNFHLEKEIALLLIDNDEFK